MRYKGYLIDLDGTVYRGRRAIPEAVELLRHLKEKGIPYLFLTNNSTRLPEDVALELQAMGIPAEPTDVLTSAQVAARYVTMRFSRPRLYVVGEDGLVQTLIRAGCRLVDDRSTAGVDAVVVGLDRQFSYDKLARAVQAIREGAVFIGTNGDRLLPTDGGWLPGNGSLCAAIEAASGTAPLFMGKPEVRMTEAALSKLNLERRHFLLVGDNLATDIPAGINAGIDTLLVLTGVTSAHDVKASNIRPTYIVHDLREWLENV